MSVSTNQIMKRINKNFKLKEKYINTELVPFFRNYRMLMIKFCVCPMTARNTCNPKIQDQIAHTWMEQDYLKGSNQIASAVFHCLNQEDLSKYSHTLLHADGCSG